MGRFSKLLLLAFVAILACRFFLYRSIGYSADDALITFRYAGNIAAGNGFVYNEGERVLGTTTPLFTLLIAASIKLGVSPFLAAFILNSLADLVTAWCLWWLFSSSIWPSARERPGFSNLVAMIPPLLFLLSPETLHWAMSGMETEMYIALLFLAFVSATRGSWTLAFVAGSLATLTRIDGAAVLVALTAAHVLRRGKLPAVPIAVACAVLLPWVLFAFLYFGSPVPNSAAAKWALSGQNHLVSGAKILLFGFLHLNTFGVPVLLLAILGFRQVARERRDWAALAIWTAGYALSYAAAAGPMHPWYYAPFYAGYLPLVWLGIGYLLSRLPSVSRAAAAGAGAFMIIVVLILSYYRLEEIRRDHSGINAMNRRVGEWVAMHAGPSDVVAFKDIGFAGYYSKARVLDLAGLVSPRCVPYRARNDFLGPIRDFHPRFFAFSEGQARTLQLDRSDLVNSYRQVAEIREGSGAFRIYELR